MKLLLDENLSRRLVPFLLTAYTESTQVVLVGLEAAEDARVWDYAKANDFVIVNQDADFEELSLVKGHPLPRVHGWRKACARSCGWQVLGTCR